MSVGGSGLTRYINALPRGGTTGQVLVKVSDADYDCQWVTIAGGTKSFFFYNTASSIATYYQILAAANTGALQSLTTAGVTDGLLLASFATDAGVPNVEYIQAGLVNFHIHAHQTAGTKTSQMYFKLYYRNLAGTETLICTSSYTNELAGSDAGYYSDAVAAFTPILTTDRLVVKVYAYITGGGSAPTIELDMGNSTAARIDIPYGSA